MAIAKNLTGKKVYSNGSYAPTRGQVDPRGYIQRELRKQNTQQGQSQSRSGLAAAALQRTKAPSAPKQPNKPAQIKSGGKTTIKPTKLGSATHSPSWTKNVGTNGVKTIQNGTPPAATEDKPTHVVDPAPTVPPAEIPHVEIDSNGQLNLPFDAEIASQMRNAQIAMNNQLLQLQFAQQQQAMDYTRGKRDLTGQFEEAKYDTLNQEAANGMAFSSQYGNKVNKNATLFNNALTDLDQQNALGNNQNNMQRMMIQNAFNQMLQDLAWQQSQKLAPEAGDLGYGTGGDGSDASPVIPQVPGAPATPPVGGGFVTPWDGKPTVVGVGVKGVQPNTIPKGVVKAPNKPPKKETKKANIKPANKKKNKNIKAKAKAVNNTIKTLAKGK